MISGNYTYTTIPAGTTDEAGIAAAHGLRLMSYSVRETAGSTATLNLCHGTDGTTVIAGINLAAAGSTGQSFLPQGLPVDAGIWVERLTGESQINLTTAIL